MKSINVMDIQIIKIVRTRVDRTGNICILCQQILLRLR